MKVLAVDFGGSHVSCALVQDRQIVSERQLPTDAASLKELLPRLADAMNECQHSARSSGPVRGLAVGFCGLLRAGTNQVTATFGKYTDAADFDWDGWAGSRFGLPIRVENDAQLALLGEVWAGAGQGLEDVVMMTIGTGIGGAAMVGGKLLRSRSGMAGALGGHLCLQPLGRPCVCGSRGCAEAEASSTVLPELCRTHPGFATSQLATAPVLNFEELFRCAASGDAVACTVCDHCLGVWCALTVSLIHAYGPQRVLFGGGVMAQEAEILPKIRAHVDQHVCRPAGMVPEIMRARLGRDAALLGGEALFAGDVQS